jgi:hypothetical protein
MDYILRGYKTLDCNNVEIKANTPLNSNQLQNPPKIITGTVAKDPLSDLQMLT